MYIFLIGLLFGFVFKKTGSLWTVILLHGFHNYVLSII
ncbi:CPBP family glutamic-type intramembrane protease [Lysinibacillus pakistanensis]